MPPHPLGASINHINQQAFENIEVAVQKWDMEQVLVEAKHASYASDMLDEYSLRGGTEYFEKYIERYESEIRPAYIKKSKPEYVEGMEISWQFYDGAISAYWYHKKNT